MPGRQKRTTDPLKLELQVIVSDPTWVLGTELGFFAKKHMLLAVSVPAWLAHCHLNAFA